MRKARQVVFKCLFGWSEAFDESIVVENNIDYLCFTDDKSLKDRGPWKFVLIKNSLVDSHRLSKRFKHLGPLILSDYDESIYIDNTVKLKMSPSSIFQRFRDSKFALFQHPCRDCVYDEADAVIAAHYDFNDLVLSQMETYRQAGILRHGGLHATTFLYRKHGDIQINNFCVEWHAQVLEHSKRDQLSFDVCRQLLQLSVSTIDENLCDNSMFSWPHVHGHRLPRDFDPKMYFSLNSDVELANVDAGFHYLNYGIKEGRQYKYA